MKRSPRQRLSLVAAVLLGTAPLGFGLFRFVSTGSDLRMFWVALVSSLFAGGVLAAAIGRRRGRHAVRIQSAVIFVVAALLAAGMATLLGATAAAGVWGVAVVFGACLAATSGLVAASRPNAG